MKTCKSWTFAWLSRKQELVAGSHCIGSDWLQGTVFRVPLGNVWKISIDTRNWFNWLYRVIPSDPPSDPQKIGSLPEIHWICLVLLNVFTNFCGYRLRVEVLKTKKKICRAIFTTSLQSKPPTGNPLPRSKKTFFYLAILVVGVICLNVFFRVGFNMTAMFFPQCEVYTWCTSADHSWNSVAILVLGVE